MGWQPPFNSGLQTPENSKTCGEKLPLCSSFILQHPLIYVLIVLFVLWIEGLCPRIVPGCLEKCKFWWRYRAIPVYQLNEIAGYRRRNRGVIGIVKNPYGQIAMGYIGCIEVFVSAKTFP